MVPHGQPAEGIRTDAINAFNKANPDAKLSMASFQNDAFKAKIRTAIGANQAPTIIPTWGGGGLRDYVKNSQVEDLTSFFAENAALKDKLFASAFGAATVDGKIYAVPCETVAPIVMYYNKKLFQQVGAEIPRPGTSSWPSSTSSRRRASPRSPSAVSRAGRT